MFSKTRVLSITSLAFLFFFFSTSLKGQFRILLYTETGGYNHGTEQVCKALLDSLGTAHNFIVDLDNTGDTFSVLDSLNNYEIVLWANTSGSNILTMAQQANFEQYMAAGGNMMGIHAATDTYRHSTANGSWKGHWDWYAETLGASVQSGPNHTQNNHMNFMDHQLIHQAIDSLPNPWQHAEEYYYWENGYFDSVNNQTLLKVRQTANGTNVNTYDSARAIAWIKDYVGGGRVFYTALGHNKSSYQYDPLFKVHIRDAILALAFPSQTVLNVLWEYAHLESTPMGNKLSWKVQPLPEDAVFLVERKHEGMSQWESLAYIPVHLQTPFQGDFTFTDEFPAAEDLLYRIAYQSPSGLIHYSKQLKTSAEQSSQLHIQNPISDQLHMRFRHEVRGSVLTEIYNISGKKVREFQVEKDSYVVQHTQDLYDLPGGIYFLKVSAKGLNFVARILKY